MTTNSLLGINLLSPVLFYQNPIDIFQTQEGSTQVNGLPLEINSCRECNQNLASNNPASQYQRQKLIQNTVRQYASLYTMNLAGLAGYQKPLNKSQFVEQNGSVYLVPPKVYWNQMSDRARPAHQKTKVASGSTYHTSSTRHTITRHRPGAMSPGGVGVDIKHNSYDRYLNKLKGKAPLRRGIIPPNYGAPIPFNRAYPIYGGKIVKTSIINGCDCPDILDNFQQDQIIYGPTSNAIQDNILSIKNIYNIGDFILTKKYANDNNLYKAQIIEIDGNNYKIKFDDGFIKLIDYRTLSNYFDCKNTCQPNIREQLVTDLRIPNLSKQSIDYNEKLYCDLLNIDLLE